MGLPAIREPDAAANARARGFVTIVNSAVPNEHGVEPKHGHPAAASVCEHIRIIAMGSNSAVQHWLVTHRG